jgi:hypothetical protein
MKLHAIFVAKKFVLSDSSLLFGKLLGVFATAFILFPSVNARALNIETSRAKVAMALGKFKRLSVGQES